MPTTCAPAAFCHQQVRQAELPDQALRATNGKMLATIEANPDYIEVAPDEQVRLLS